MKKTVLALSLVLASTTALASTGSISFNGHVDAGTCAIEIIDPQTGLPMSRIHMGNVNAAQFTEIDAEAANRAFGMRLTPGGGCTLLPGATATVGFSGAYGGAGANGALYALQPGGSTGIAVVIKDDTGTPVVNGAQSKSYALHDTAPTEMLFSVAYKATDTVVEAGQASTDIRFMVDVH